MKEPALSKPAFTIQSSGLHQGRPGTFTHIEERYHVIMVFVYPPEGGRIIEEYFVFTPVVRSRWMFKRTIFSPVNDKRIKLEKNPYGLNTENFRISFPEHSFDIPLFLFVRYDIGKGEAIQIYPLDNADPIN